MHCSVLMVSCVLMQCCVLMVGCVLMQCCLLMVGCVLMECCSGAGRFLLRGVAWRSVNSAVILVATPPGCGVTGQWSSVKGGCALMGCCVLTRTLFLNPCSCGLSGAPDCTLGRLCTHGRLCTNSDTFLNPCSCGLSGALDCTLGWLCCHWGYHTPHTATPNPKRLNADRSRSHPWGFELPL